MERITYLVVNGSFLYGGRRYTPGCVFAANEKELSATAGLGISLMPFKNTIGGRRLLKPDEDVMTLPGRSIENIKLESLMVAYHQLTKIPFDAVRKMTREMILEDIAERKRRWLTVSRQI